MNEDDIKKAKKPQEAEPLDSKEEKIQKNLVSQNF